MVFVCFFSLLPHSLNIYIYIYITTAGKLNFQVPIDDNSEYNYATQFAGTGRFLRMYTEKSTPSASQI